jgi:WD40 repeat protein
MGAAAAFVVVALLGAQAPWLTLETGRHSAAVRRVDADRAGGRVLSTSEDGTARLWDAATGRLLHTLRPPLTAGAERALRAAALSPDGKTAIVGWKWRPRPGADVCLHVFDADSGALRGALCGLDGPAEDAAFSPDGKYLAVGLRGPRGVRIIDVATGDIVGATAAADATYNVAWLPDGRLVAASFDRSLRLITADTFKVERKVTTTGSRVYDVDVHPSGTLLAVAYEDRPLVELRYTRDLSVAYTAETGRVGRGGVISAVAFTHSGDHLVGGGTWRSGAHFPLLIWDQAGRGRPRQVDLARNTIMDLVALKDGVAVAAYDPLLAAVSPRGEVGWTQRGGLADVRGNRQRWRISGDGQTVELDVAPAHARRPGAPPAVRWSLRARRLTDVSSPDPALRSPRVAEGSLAPHGWEGRLRMAILGDKPLPLDAGERALSVAVAKGGDGFLLGGDYRLRWFDQDGNVRWAIPVPGPAWAVALPARAPLAIAALGDGTVRTYRRRDGEELLALAITEGGREWAAWTPSGFFDASPRGAEQLVWVQSRGDALAPTVTPARAPRQQRLRPDIIDGVLAWRDEPKAIRAAAADVAVARPPVVHLLTPVPLSDVRRSPIEVTVRVDTLGQPLTRLQAHVDGRPVASTRGIAPKRQASSGVRTLVVPLPPRDVSLTVVARTTAGVGSSAAVPLVWRGSRSEGGTLHYVVVATNDYTSPRIADLRYPEVDARALARALDGLKGTPWRRVEGRTLLGAAATPDAVTAALDSLRATAGPEDLAIVFLAGHGVVDGAGDYHLLLAGTDPGALDTTALSTDDLRTHLAMLRSRTLVLLDTCHAGEALGSRVAARRIDAVSLDLASPEAGLAVMAASSGRQASLEDPSWGHGAFTKALLEGLSGQARYGGDDRVTLGMLELYVSERVRALTGGQQTPVIAKPASVPDFVVVGPR